MSETTKSPTATSQCDPLAAEPHGGRQQAPAVHPSPETVQARTDAAIALSRHGSVWADAAREWEWRGHAAAQMVRTGKWTEADRARELAPWLAIACLCDVSTPETDEAIYRHRVTVVNDPDKTVTRPQAILRAAAEICPDTVWRRELARAAATASSHYLKTRAEADGEHLSRLARLTGALGVPLPEIPFGSDAEPQNRDALLLASSRAPSPQETKDAA